MIKNSAKLILILGKDLKIALLNQATTITNLEEYSLDKHDIIDGIIFNITKIENFITTFIAAYKLKNVTMTIVLKDTIIIQALNENLKLDPQQYHLYSYELQFYPHSVFYYLGIHHYQLFQYSLLCAKLSIELECVTSSLLGIYKLFKTRCHKAIDVDIKTTQSLIFFMKETIKESPLLDSICNTPKDFDKIFSLY